MDLATMVLACSLYNDNSLVNAMAQVGSQNNALMVTLEGSNPTVFPTLEKANSYANDEIAQGKVVDIGLMQVPSSWLKQYHVTPADILKPCKNIAVATHILSDAMNTCATNSNGKNSDLSACALSMYKTGNPTAGADYAQKVLAYSTSNPFVKPPSTENTTTPPPAETQPASVKKHAHKIKHHKHGQIHHKAAEPAKVTPIEENAAPEQNTMPVEDTATPANAT